jgi:bacillithiol system protein YtxJ
MKWIALTREEQLEDLVKKSDERPQAIFKYSSRCSLSDMIKDRLERKGAPEGIDFYFLDLIAYRALSGRIATMFHVHHESPQVLLIRNGECVYDESHAGIRMDELVEQSMI